MASIISVNPLPGRAQGTAACKMPCSWQLVRGTRAINSVRCCQKSRCRQRLLHRIVNRRELSALRAGKLRAGLEIQPDFQLPACDVHLALDHFPPTAQSQGLPEKNICVHTRKNLPSKNQPVPALFAQAGRATPSKFPPNACRGERCGAWGRKAPIKPVLYTHSKCRGAEKMNALPPD